MSILSEDLDYIPTLFEKGALISVSCNIDKCRSVILTSDILDWGLRERVSEFISNNTPFNAFHIENYIYGQIGSIRTDNIDDVIKSVTRMWITVTAKRVADTYQFFYRGWQILTIRIEL